MIPFGYECPFCGGDWNSHSSDCFIAHVFKSGIRHGEGAFSKYSAAEIDNDMQRTWVHRYPAPAIPIREAQEPKKAKFIPYSADSSTGGCSECYGYLHKSFKFCPSCGCEIESDERKD